MKPRRLSAALAIVALLLQALMPLGPRAEATVICGTGPTVVLLDLVTGQPAAPEDRHGCCGDCLRCGGCPVHFAPAGVAAPTAMPTHPSAPAGTKDAADGTPRTPVRVRGPPAAAAVL